MLKSHVICAKWEVKYCCSEQVASRKCSRNEEEANALASYMRKGVHASVPEMMENGGARWQNARVEYNMKNVLPAHYRSSACSSSFSLLIYGRSSFPHSVFIGCRFQSRNVEKWISLLLRWLITTVIIYPFSNFYLVVVAVCITSILIRRSEMTDWGPKWEWFRVWCFIFSNDFSMNG